MAKLDILAAQNMRMQPVRICTLDLEYPATDLTAYDQETGKIYSDAWILVRLYGQPIGLETISFDTEHISATSLRDRIWKKYNARINAILQDNGMKSLDYLRSDDFNARQFPSRTPPDQPFVSIIVCTRDRTEQLQRCLLSLSKQSYPSYEIIVVDNAPRTSDTANLLQERYKNARNVRYVRENRPGLSWARNCGLHAAQGTIVAFTDDDVHTDSQWIERLVMAFDAAKNVVCVTGLTLPAELETEAQLYFERFGGFNKGCGFERAIYNLNDHRPLDPLFPYVGTKFGSGVNMAFRASFLRVTGGFDPALGTGMPSQGGEEAEVFFRVIDRGYSLVYEPGAIVWHYHRRDYTGLERQLHSYGIAFTAYLTRLILEDPRRIVDLILRTPSILRYVLSPTSPRNSRKGIDFPHKLAHLELAGMLHGPLAYLRSRQIVRTTMRTSSIFDQSAS